MDRGVMSSMDERGTVLNPKVSPRRRPLIWKSKPEFVNDCQYQWMSVIFLLLNAPNIRVWSLGILVSSTVISILCCVTVRHHSIRVRDRQSFADHAGLQLVGQCNTKRVEYTQSYLKFQEVPSTQL